MLSASYENEGSREAFECSKSVLGCRDLNLPLVVLEGHGRDPVCLGITHRSGQCQRLVMGQSHLPVADEEPSFALLTPTRLRRSLRTVAAEPVIGFQADPRQYPGLPYP